MQAVQRLLSSMATPMTTTQQITMIHEKSMVFLLSPGWMAFFSSIIQEEGAKFPERNGEAGPFPRQERGKYGIITRKTKFSVSTGPEGRHAERDSIMIL